MKKLNLMAAALMLLAIYAGAQTHPENVKPGSSEDLI
jgi:hypothetical protein